MVQSSRCHLKDLSPSKLVDLKEEANEMGGYFIMNGIERVIRYITNTNTITITIIITITITITITTTVTITITITIIIRLLQVQRRNYAMAIERSSYKNRGTSYSDKGILILKLILILILILILRCSYEMCPSGPIIRNCYSSLFEQWWGHHQVRTTQARVSIARCYRCQGLGWYIRYYY